MGGNQWKVPLIEVANEYLQLSHVRSGNQAIDDPSSFILLSCLGDFKELQFGNIHVGNVTSVRSHISESMFICYKLLAQTAAMNLSLER